MSGRRPFFRYLVLLSGLSAPGTAWALDLIRIDTPHLELPGGVTAAGVRLGVRLKATGLVFDLQIDRISLPVGETLTRVRLYCPELRFEEAVLLCRSGRLAFSDSTFGRVRYSIELSHDRRAGRLAAAVKGKGEPFRTLRLQLDLQDAVRGRLEVEQISVPRLAEWIARFGRLRLPVEVSGGAATLRADAHMRGADWRWRLEGEVRGLAFSNPEGTLAAEDAGFAWRANGGWRGGQAKGRLRIEWRTGGVYADPLYLEVTGRQPPVRFDTAFRWRRGLILHELRYHHPGVLTATLDRLQWPVPERPSLVLEVDALDLESAWPRYLQPWLAGTTADDLKLAGGVKGRLRLVDGEPYAVRLQVRDARVTDRFDRIRLEGLEIDLEHARDGRRHASRIRWRGGRLHRIVLGASELPLTSRDARWELQRETTVPVFDGRLLVDRLFVEASPDAGSLPRWGIDAVLTPVSLRRLSAAFGWPPFEGTLSGVVPDVLYADHRLSVGGVLLAQVFDGYVRVRHLVLERPFGRFPRLTADIEIDRLDLAQLTSAFSFGRIEGRLSGYVRHLVLEDWEPVAFDAWLGTPEDYRGPRRISQRAVENLSSIGGGATGALSRGILRFFETFPYARLGLGCRLENGVCRMRGVAPAAQGYYIVKGRLLPRLDVVGYATEVDWKTLLERLEAATRGGEAKVR